MNPSLKFLLILIISFELSVVNNLAINLIIIGAALLYLIIHKISFKDLLLLLFAPLVAAFTIFSTLYWFTPKPDHAAAWIFSTRIYVYVLTIACLSKTTTSSQLAKSFEQNLHLPSKFAYGILAALNLLPQIKSAVQQIRTSAMMRGIYLSFWSPVLYFKAILVALSSADNLAQGMASHGFDENSQRSAIVKIPLTRHDWILFCGALLIFNLTLIFCAFFVHI